MQKVPSERIAPKLCSLSAIVPGVVCEVCSSTASLFTRSTLALEHTCAPWPFCGN
jgi:hypothetical protein